MADTGWVIFLNDGEVLTVAYLLLSVTPVDS